ncbi:hypothetical protein M413DRAFT_341356 [Hebeloma cylindrosporum]|uniref:Pali-domain-containing protein n=1 Tax=Hebeloma cylindrosporum TaxID=76867 RepID=A0A0C2YWT8_HEBCY|nr:hypothetical protein M413DRAFT_341356 [Hebeloma cylindrosporum h7]
MVFAPIYPAIAFCFAAMVLLLFVSISVPTWGHVSFLTVGKSHELKYGIFGSTGHGPSVGYYFTNGHMNSTILHNLTKTLILHALGMAGFAFFFGIIAAAAHVRICAVIMTLLAGFGMMTTFVAWVIDMILFGIARQRYRNDGNISQYGNANWLTLGALVALTLGFCTSTCSIFGRYRRKRGVTY